ncbi:MAG: hypothetical protein WAN75_34245 [Xanthobacteraceae bacterium]
MYSSIDLSNSMDSRLLSWKVWLILLAEILYRTKHPVEISTSASGARTPASLKAATKASFTVDMDA